MARPARAFFGTPGYRGEFFGSDPVRVESWTPNGFVLYGTPGDTVTLNVNPSSYWLMNGERLFPNYRTTETQRAFTVSVPTSGRMEFLARPPAWYLFAIIQGIFALTAAVLLAKLSRKSLSLAS
jgi:hypothetical protein